jgi:uncharacterized damage-inducible protein DinB
VRVHVVSPAVHDRAMTIPMPDRREPDLTADERPLLTGFLDYYRDTLATKCAGLSAEQLAERAVPPSPLSLLGLVRHMAEVELGWFRRFNGEDVVHRYSTEDNPDGEFLDAAAKPEQVDEAYRYWQEEVRHAREVVAAHSLDDTFTRRGATFSLRWILVHMIEEYARHCGHADFLRERIDGDTGD